MINLWQNILGHQQEALDSLRTTIPNRNYHTNHSSLILQKKNLLENLARTDKQTNRQGILLQRPLISPMDRRDERANKIDLYFLLKKIQIPKRKLQNLRNLNSAYQFHEIQKKVLREYSPRLNPTLGKGYKLE